MKRKKLAERILPDYTKGEEIFNMASHAAGAALGIVVTVLCVVRAAFHHSGIGVVGGAIFGATMILLYSISSVYHGLSPRVMGKKVLRFLDHCTIYLLIAGTYTPLALSALRPAHPALGWTIFGVVWGAAAIGILLTAIDMERFKVFSMICYLAMGWCIVVAMKPTEMCIRDSSRTSAESSASFTSVSVKSWPPTACPMACASCGFRLGIIPGVSGNCHFPSFTALRGRNSIFTAM